jgi:enamine deaminase RidA (YjgF/YER057c/UK114 family)
MWQRDKRFYPSYEGVRKFWQPVASPSSGLGVSRVTGRYGRWIGIDSMAIDIADADNLGAREVLAAPDYAKLPSASIYSQAVASGPLVFLAGHIPIRTAAPGKPVVAGFDDLPPEGRFLETGRSHPDSRDGPIAAQTWFVYNEIFRNLADHGLGPADVVHLNVYLSDLRDLATFHRVHLHFFGADGPAICVTGFDEVGHKGCRIEIEPTALRRSEKLTPSQIPWPCRPPMSGPAAVCAGPLLFISGMLGLTDDGHIAKGAETVEPASRDFVRSLEAKGGTPGVAVQSWMAWHRLRQVCETAGVPLSALAKTIVYLKDEADLGIYEAVRASFISENLPAFDCTVIHGPGPVPDAVVQIDAIGLLT